MYQHEAGRAVKIKTVQFGQEKAEVKALSLITGIRVKGIKAVKVNEETGTKSQTIQFGGDGKKAKFATAFDEAIDQLKDIKVGDLVNLEVLPSGLLFRYPNPAKPEETLIATPRMSKIYRVEKSTPRDVEVSA
jgi:hypothetical protein